MTPPPLLVLRALGLGDLLCAVPALRALRAAHPGGELLLAAPAGLAPLVALIGIDPRRPPAEPGDRVVDRLLPLPAAVGGVPPDLAGADGLPRGAIAVNLHGDGPESHRLLLAAAPSELLAFAHADVPESAGGPPARDDRESVSIRGIRTRGHRGPEHERERWCRLLRAYGIPADPEALGLAPPPAPPCAGTPPARAAPAAPPAAAPLAPGTTLIHPGAASAARRWPAERWAEVARAERDAGRPVVITGSAAERSLAQEIATRATAPAPRTARATAPRTARAATSAIAVSAGTTDLLALTCLVAAAGRVICGDSGVAHLATALGTPSVVLFGPTSPAIWGPPPDRPQHVVLWHPPTCTGERGDPHADRPDPALLAIEADEVVAAAAQLAAGDRAAGPSRTACAAPAASGDRPAARRSHLTASTAP